MTRTLLTAIFLTLFSQTALGSTKLICGYDENWGAGYEDWSLKDVQSDDIIKSLQRKHMIIEVNKEKKEINYGYSIGPDQMDAQVRTMPIKELIEEDTEYLYIATEISRETKEGLTFVIRIDRIDGSFEIDRRRTRIDSLTGRYEITSTLMKAGVCEPYSKNRVTF